MQSHWYYCPTSIFPQFSQPISHSFTLSLLGSENSRRMLLISQPEPSSERSVSSGSTLSWSGGVSN